MAPGAEREVPPFSLTEPRYDQSTFLGRTRLLYELTDARTLLKSSEEISQAKTLLDEYAAGRTPQTVSDSDLWAARSLTESALHPDTGEELPRPFRFAAFGPVNVPICAAMLVPNASASWTAGVQLVNQVCILWRLYPFVWPGLVVFWNAGLAKHHTANPSSFLFFFAGI